MKTINLKNGKSEKLYKPHEVAMMLGYNPRTIRRFIQSGRIDAINSNASGKQPVWWITEKVVTLFAETYFKTASKKTK